MRDCRYDFPYLNTPNSHPLVYLDSASSTQKPTAVLEAMKDFNAEHYANIHRGIYQLSQDASNRYEAARSAVARFINADASDEIIFTAGTTASINLVADGFARGVLQQGDAVVISEMEHHSNLVPWQRACEQTGAILKVCRMTDNFELDLDHLDTLLTDEVRLVALVHVSNVLGTINPVKKVIDMAHAKDIAVLLDGAQAVPHMPVDVQALDCDFYAFSAHKTYGPTGVGVLYGKRVWLEKLPPYQLGGGMIESVSFDQTTYASAPMKFEAGTPPITQAVGLHAALDYLTEVSMAEVAVHEAALGAYLREQFSQLEGLTLFAPVAGQENHAGVFSFVVEDLHAHDLGTMLDAKQIAVRAGHHCTMPLHGVLGVASTLRVSLGIYNTLEDIDLLVNALREAIAMWRQHG